VSLVDMVHLMHLPKQKGLKYNCVELDVNIIRQSTQEYKRKGNEILFGLEMGIEVHIKEGLERLG
jgi:hypothetical protein